jgi:selenide,water dikinase
MELTAVESTNIYAMDHLQANLAAHGSAFFAHYQTGGKGRHGKSWLGDPGNNIALSVILDCSFLSLTRQFSLSVMVAVACYDLFNKYATDAVFIKWPNDIYWRDRKAGGILIENQVRGNKWQAAVVGIGMNINQTFFEELKNPVSLKQITGKDFNTISLAKELCDCLEKRYIELKNGGFEEQLLYYNTHLFKRGENVRLKNKSAAFYCTINGVSADGELNVAGGPKESFRFGEVEWMLGNENIELLPTNKMDITKLTQFSHGAGCGCKIAPAVLDAILQTKVPFSDHKQLLVGNKSKDDAAVYDLGNGSALISTTDFFTPIVDDAFSFGKIAGANAISDVYAMGGKPILAIAILGWPVDALPATLAQQVLDGAREICAEAGIPLAGGHSIDTPEPFFGLSVNGLVDIIHLKQNNTAKAGDLLLLTKPLGVGILATAQKKEVLKEEHFILLLAQLSALNKAGQALGKINGVHAMTDVTGFGLLGHLIEMAEGSGLSADLIYNNIPVLDAAKEYLPQRIIPDATYRNWNGYSSKVGFAPGVNVMEAFTILPDPQTNGGLLIAVAPDAINQVKDVFSIFGLNDFAEPIGIMTAQSEKIVTIK